MDKKNFITPTLVVGLSLIFIVVSLGVFLSNGKSRFWISKKIKVGAMLLSLTTLAMVNQSCVNCYDPAPENEIVMDTDDSYVVKADLNVSNKLTGILYDRNMEDFSFNIINESGADTVQVGEIQAADGKFDEGTEEIVIELDSGLPTSTYTLNLYQGKPAAQTYPMSTYQLEVKNEDKAPQY